MSFHVANASIVYGSVFNNSRHLPVAFRYRVEDQCTYNDRGVHDLPHSERKQKPHKERNQWTYHNNRIRDARDDVKVFLEREGQIAEDAPKHIDEHEEDGDADDLLVLVDLPILRSVYVGCQLPDDALTTQLTQAAYIRAVEISTELKMPKNCTGRILP